MEKKYPESDPLFFTKVRGACETAFQSGLVVILQATGMHISCLMSLTPSQMDEQGNIYWKRTKTDRQMRARIPEMDRPTARAWIGRFGNNSKTRRWANMSLKKVGIRAGFPGLSPMTFRTMRAVTLLDDGEPPHEVKHVLGCSLEVLMDNYAQLKADRRADNA